MQEMIAYQHSMLENIRRKKRNPGGFAVFSIRSSTAKWC